jgi:hypothetical protein
MILRFAGDRKYPELDGVVAATIAHRIDSIGPAYWMPRALEMLARRQGKEPDWDTEGWLDPDHRA